MSFSSGMTSVGRPGKRKRCQRQQTSVHSVISSLVSGTVLVSTMALLSTAFTTSAFNVGLVQRSHHDHHSSSIALLKSRDQITNRNTLLRLRSDSIAKYYPRSYVLFPSVDMSDDGCSVDTAADINASDDSKVDEEGTDVFATREGTADSTAEVDVTLKSDTDEANEQETRATTADTTNELQKRYEEAMKRREMRRRHVVKPVLEREVVRVQDYNLQTVRTEVSDETTGDINVAATVETTTVEPRAKVKVDSAPSSRNRTSSRSQQRVQQSKRYSSIEYQDTIYDGSSPSTDDPYDDYDNVYDEERYDTERPSTRNKPRYEWETYKSTSILFPPPSSTSKNGVPCRPKAIIHFVGGTFFGSYPRKFYGSLLEDIACKCEAVVIATPIPLVLPGKGLMNRLEKWIFDDEDDSERRSRKNAKESSNPLDHLHLAEAVQKDFNNAYRDVILDEYCADYGSGEEVEDFMRNVPIVGIGHSLGARIQAISCSHPQVSKRYLSMGKGRRLIRSGRDGMVYLGFANWGASSSIPGIETLERSARKRNDEKRPLRREGAGRRDDVWGDRNARSQRRGERRYSQYDRYSGYDVDEDLDLVDVFSDVVNGVAKGAKQIGAALTPDADDLEFRPKPNELWEDLSSSDGYYSTCCQNTLVIQFDEDPIDQGSRLARTLLNAYKNETNAADDVDTNEPLHDVKFARLQGGHLTPVSFQDGIAKILPKSALGIITSSSDYILQQLGDERSGKTSQRQRQELEDVADTVASYIRDAL